MLKRVAAATAFVAMLALPASAGEAGDIARDALYSGKLAEGLELLAPGLASGDPEAKFGTGVIYFVQAIEGLAQASYRHGLVAPDTGPMGPVLLLPIEQNPNPEPLDYEKVRLVLQRLVDQMDLASNMLQEAGAAGDYVVTLDLLRLRVDVDGDGTAEDTESVGTVIGRAFGGDTSTFAAPAEPEKKGIADKSARTNEEEKPAAPGISIGFDRADAIWLAGYAQVLAAQADFGLAHDFRDFVNATLHRLFPRAGLPMQATGGMVMIDPRTDTAVADAIAAIHSINWQVIEPDRLKRVLTRFQTVTRLSRENWTAILAETDDNAELVPNPRQTSMVPQGVVTDEVVAAWMETLDTADQILNGELLVPHWRFRQGFDLKAYFETAKRTDFVMLLSGYDALPFLKDGPVVTGESFAAANRVFGDDLLGYVFWFN